MFKTLMDFLGYEKKRPIQVHTETHSRQYWYIAQEDLETYRMAAYLEGFELKVIKMTGDWITLHLTPIEVYKIEAHGLHLIR